MWGLIYSHIINSFAHYSFSYPIPSGFNFLLPEVIPFRITFSEGLWVSNSLIQSYLFHLHLWIEVKNKKTDLDIWDWSEVRVRSQYYCRLIWCWQRRHAVLLLDKSHRHSLRQGYCIAPKRLQDPLLLNEWLQLLTYYSFFLTLVFPPDRQFLRFTITELLSLSGYPSVQNEFFDSSVSPQDYLIIVKTLSWIISSTFLLGCTIVPDYYNKW